MPVVDAEAQDKVMHLLQSLVQEHATGATVTNGLSNSTNAEAVFRAASKLLPNRLDLRFGVASALVSQAIETNGPQLELKVKQALEVYQEIQKLAPQAMEATIWYAAYTRALGDTNESEKAMQELMAVQPEPARQYLEAFRLADRVLQLTPNMEPARTMHKDQHHAIVILGAGLETNGTIKVKLTGRLKQGLKLARMYRRAPIILTGGNQKEGVTEAYVMSEWLRRRGISRKRLFLEDRARDTVENALYSAALVQKLGVTHVTVVTSSNHVRRGLADLEEACDQRGLKLEYASLAANTKGDTELDKKQERVGIYRDVLRTCGLWTYPALGRR